MIERLHVNKLKLWPIFRQATGLFFSKFLLICVLCFVFIVSVEMIGFLTIGVESGDIFDWERFSNSQIAGMIVLLFLSACTDGIASWLLILAVARGLDHSVAVNTSMPEHRFWNLDQVLAFSILLVTMILAIAWALQQEWILASSGLLIWMVMLAIIPISFLLLPIVVVEGKLALVLGRMAQLVGNHKGKAVLFFVIVLTTWILSSLPGILFSSEGERTLVLIFVDTTIMSLWSFWATIAGYLLYTRLVDLEAGIDDRAAEVFD